MRKILSIGLIALFFFSVSCDQEEDGTLSVQTEELLYVSGDQVRILGRVISSQSLGLVDHGFYLSQDESFASPEIISLGEKNGPGRFIGVQDGLTAGVPYFVKAFIELDGELIFGQVVEFSTLNAALDSFTPAFSVPGQEMTITGRNFTEGTRVFFGEVEAEVLEIRLESILRVRIPSANSNFVNIRVLAQDQELSFPDPFEYQAGDYELISSFPDSFRLYRNVFFQNSQGFWIGLGLERGSDLLNYFQRYDPDLDTWQRVEFPGSPRSFAFATENYLGGGAVEVGRDEFDYDQSLYKITSSGFERLPDLPFESKNSKAFELGGQLVVLGTEQGDPLLFKKFDESSGTWSDLATPPVVLNASNIHFIYEGKVYLISSENELWQYVGGENRWELVGRFPGSFANGFGMGQVLGDKAYVGLNRRNNEMWELDLISMEWKPKNPIPSIPQGIVVGHFQKDGFLYIMRVPDINLPGDFPMQLYRFDPNGI